MTELTEKEQEASDAISENVLDKGINAIYNAGYENGFQKGQERGYEFGRSAMTHWSLVPVTLILFFIGVVTGMFAESAFDMLAAANN